MPMPNLRHALAIVLALLMTFTSQQMAEARGQVVVADGTGLCVALHGAAPVDEGGNPADATPICPDCVVSFIITSAPPDASDVLRNLRAMTFASAAIAAHVQRPAIAPLARGPPVACLKNT